MLRAALVASSCLLSTPFARAEGVANISHSPVVVHLSLQSAIDAAADGDVLLVRGGTYTGFTIDNRSIAIFAAPGETVDVSSRVVVSNVSATKRVVLSDLNIRGGPQTGSDGEDALDITNCAGPVWIQGCELLGEKAPNGNDLFGGDACDVVNSVAVTVVDCSMLAGGGSDFFGAFGFAGTGGAGLIASGSRVAIYGSSSTGGPAGFDSAQQGAGGPGVWKSGGVLFLAGSTFVGADHFGGGSAAAVGADAPAFALDCTYIGPTFGVVNLGPSARTLDLPHVAADGSTSNVSLTGQAGDSLWLPNSESADWLLKLSANGVWTPHYPTHMPKSPLVVLPSGGSTTVSWTMPLVSGGAQTALRFVQGYALPSAGGAVLANPVCTLLLDVDAAPDCNGNGVFDVLDILAGEPDTNFDFVPDACTTQLEWYVDDDAPPGGDGSLSAPLQTIQSALDVALDGRTVRVLDGTYVGAANRDLDFRGKALVVESQNGPASTVIDCQSLGRAFHLRSGEGATTAIRGFTIVNGRTTIGSSGVGGAICVENGANLELAGCTIEDCYALGLGGAVAVLANAGTFAMRDCSFVGNETNFTYMFGGGGAVSVERDAVIARCTFVANRSYSGGAVYVKGNVHVVMTHATFVANAASERGGALTFHSFGSGQLDVSNALFAGNTVLFAGGAIYADHSQLQVQHSTFAANSTANSSASSGGGAFFLTTADATLRNCVLWDNREVNVAQQAKVTMAAGSVSFDYCDVQGGTAGINAGPGTLNWGVGNLALDPLFVDPDGPDNDPVTIGDNVYRLKATSPCLDAGDTSNAFLDVTDVDDDGDFGESVPLDVSLKTRFKDLPSVPDTGVGSPPLDLGCYERQS